VLAAARKISNCLPKIVLPDSGAAASPRLVRLCRSSWCGVGVTTYT